MGDVGGDLVIWVIQGPLNSTDRNYAGHLIHGFFFLLKMYFFFSLFSKKKLIQ